MQNNYQYSPDETKRKIVFLISQPRAGSTMLQAILGTHKQIHTSAEPWIALFPLSVFKRNSYEFNFNGKLAREALNGFLKENNIAEHEYFEHAEKFIMSFYESAIRYSGKDFFLDKTPRYYEILPELFKTFPNAKFLVLHRNPMSVMKSFFTTWVHDDIEKLFFLKRDLFVAIEQINEFISLNNNVYSVKYEDIITSPESEISKICNYIGVEYNQEILNYNKEPNWIYGDKKILSLDTVDKQKTYSDGLDNLNQLQLNFLSFYIKELGEEKCRIYGYEIGEILDAINKHGVNNKYYDLWKIIINAKLFNNLEDTFSIIRNKIRKRLFLRRKRLFLRNTWRKIVSL